MSRQANLTAGELRFSDPSIPWTPANFPVLPSTALTLTTNSFINGSHFSTLTLQNTVNFEPYENSTILNNKILHISANGVVSYTEPHPTTISTSLNAYNIPINTFATAAIGAAGLSTSDTLTNAIAKLDGWLSHSLLEQPPTVSTVQIETNTFYGGVRWNNFNSYNILNTTIPTVNAIVFILGDPNTNDYLTLKLTNPDWFPDRLYTNGLLADGNPIVRLRVFSTVFPCSSVAYSKAVAAKKCITVIGESGRFALAESGKVLAIDTFPNKDDYTTFNLHLPNVPAGEIIPVNIAYINNTGAPVNIAQTNIVVDTGGTPSAPQNAIQNGGSQSTISVQIQAPEFSDAIGGVSEPAYISSYTITYDYLQLNIAHSGNRGFRFGSTTPFDTPLYAAPYTVTVSTSAAYITSTQTTTLPPILEPVLIPGIQWFNTVTATNSAGFTGPATVFSTITAFPIPDAPTISSATIIADGVGLVGEVGIISQNGSGIWDIAIPDNTALISLISSSVIRFRLSEPVKFIDNSYPGARSNVTIRSYINDAISDEIILSSFMDDFPLNIWLSTVQDLRVNLTDTAATEPYQKFFYNVDISAPINTIADSQTAFFTLTYPWFASYDSPIISNRTLSTPLQTIYTDYLQPTTTTTNIMYNSTIVAGSTIAGIQTTGGVFCDIYGSNFATGFASYTNGFAWSQLSADTIPIGDPVYHRSSIALYVDGIPIISTSLPQASTICISSCYLPFDTVGLYQNPATPSTIALMAAVVNPYTYSANIVSSILGSGPFVDMISVSTISAGIDNPRLVSLMPRPELLPSETTIYDGVGGIGLNTDISSVITMGYSNILSITSSIVYNHLSTISTVYSDYYSRELIYTGGKYRHPNGLDFSQFSILLPDFTDDLLADTNFGNRYAQFVFNESFIGLQKQFVNIRIVVPSAIGAITSGSRINNDLFPNAPVASTDLQYIKLNLYVKIIASYIDTHYKETETAWINCFKQIDYSIFDSSVFDIGGCVDVTSDSNDIIYKIQIDRREYLRMAAIVRIGIAADAPMTFENITVEFTV